MPYCTVFIVLAEILVFGREWKRISEKDNSSTKDQAKSDHYKGPYGLGYLFIIFLTAFLISINYHYEHLMAIYPLLGIECVFLGSMIKSVPYQSCLDNFGAFLNRIAVDYFLIWSIMREYFSQLQSE